MDKEFETIGGVRHEVGTPGHGDACKRRDQRRADSAKKAKDARKRLDTLQAKVDTLTAENGKLKAALTQANSPQRLDHAVKVRAAVIRRAAPVLGAKFKMDGLSIPAIKVAAVKAYHKTIKLDGKSQDYVNALFRAIPAAKRRSDGSGGGSGGYMRLDGNRIDGGEIPEHLRGAPEGFDPTGQGQALTMDHYRARRNDAEEDRHRRPLTVSKSNPHREMDGYPAIQGSMLENMR